MEMEEYLPSAALKPYIKYYRIFESDHEVISRVLPMTSFAIAFQLKGQISYQDHNKKLDLTPISFSGLRKSVRMIKYTAKTATLIVYFKEMGVTAFFKEPLYQLYEESVSLAHFFQESEISLVEERIAEKEENKDKIAVVEEFLCSKLRPAKMDMLIATAIAKMNDHHGLIRIKELAHDLNISQDRLEKRFRQSVGASPKQFTSIIKLQHIITQNQRDSNFLHAALEHGYYDQSHFIKDFKNFTGLTPTEFFVTDNYW